MPDWRLTLDVPFSFAVEQGFLRDMKSCDFREDKQQVAGLWREPINGIIMLLPSVLERGFTSDFKGLGNWSYQGAFWRAAKRAQAIKNFPNPDPNPDPDQPFALLMAPVKPAGQRFELIELLLADAIMAIKFDVLWKENYDDMKWVMESSFTLAEDESFAIHYHGLTDEMVRKENWFCIKRDNIGLHFSHTGIMRVFKYDTDPTLPPKLLEEVEICQPGDILNRHGFFYFIPIPNLGLAVYHGLRSPKTEVSHSSARNVAVHGKMVTWPTNIDGDGHAFLFNSSTVKIGMNPYHPTLIGFQVIRFPLTPQTFADGAFTIPYLPTLAPSSVDAGGVADRGALSASLKNPENTAAWEPGTSAARVAVTLQTGDARYTPFCGTYSVRWLPVFATRDTTPLVLANRAADGEDRLMRLEWSDDCSSHFEGEAELLLFSNAARAIAGRGDATFLLEYRATADDDWITFTGGLAKQWIVDIEWDGTWGTHAKCKVKLLDMWERFDETHVLWQTAFDSLSIGTALNNVLTGTGFSRIPDMELPADAVNTKLSNAPDGSSWRYSPREGEKSQDVIALLLLYLRRQNVQYRMRFDWTSPKWVLELRPRDLATIWTLTPFALGRSEDDSIWDYSHLRLMPEPPEGNIVIVEGLVTPDPQHAQRISVKPLTNVDSLSNPSHPDYLGRCLIFKADVPEVTDEMVLAAMERRYYDAIAHHRGKGIIESQHFTFGLEPNRRIQVYAREGNLLLDTWIKRRTVVIEDLFEGEKLRLETDTIWDEPTGRA